MPTAARAVPIAAALLTLACGLPGPKTSSPTPRPTPTPPPVAPPPAAFDAGVYVVYVTQATQTFDGKVPLVQGRDALARVFLIAKQAGIPAPPVQLELRDTPAGAVLRTYSIPPPVSTVPTAWDETSLATSWNATIAGADLQPGRHLVATVPTLSGVASQQTTLRHPAAGSLDVRAVATLPVTLVPIVQSGLTPNVQAAPRTADSWLDRSRRIHPVLATDLQVAAPFTTSIALYADEAACGNRTGCDGWANLLGALQTKQAAEAGSGRHYVGAVKVGYNSGVAGIGYIGGRTLLAWDYSSYQKVVAHELGHNFGREHVGCTQNGFTIDGVDPNYPKGPTYDGGHIGVFGWDPVTPGVLKAPTGFYDHMSYCGKSDGSDTWTSDYNYRGVMTFLSGRLASVGDAAAAVRQPCLLVSGSIEGGVARIGSAFALDGVPSLPPPGDHALEILDASGVAVASFPFAPAEVALELPGREAPRHFAAVVPIPAGWSASPGALRVVSAGRELARAKPFAAWPSRPLRSAAAGGKLYLSWDGEAHPRALVRHASTGEVLGIVGGGEALLEADAAEVEVVLSGAPQGARERVRMR